MRFFNSLILIASIVAPSSVSAQRRCKDSNMPFVHDDETVTCHDIGDDIPWSVCEDDSVVMSHCPMTCDQCDDYMCVDSEAKMKKGGRKRNGKTFYCSWLDESDDEDIEFLCSIKKFQRSCRDTCGYCDYTMDFDKIETDDEGFRPILGNFAYKQTNIRFYGPLAVTDGRVWEYYDDDEFKLPLDELIVSEPNFIITWNMAFDCVGGTFSLKSLYLAQLVVDDYYSSTTVYFQSWNEDGYVGVKEVELEPNTVEFVEFEQGGNFTDIEYFFLYAENGAMLGMDNIDVHITSPCIPYSGNYDEKSAHHEEALARLPEEISSAKAPWSVVPEE